MRLIGFGLLVVCLSFNGCVPLAVTPTSFQLSKETGEYEQEFVRIYSENQPISATSPIVKFTSGISLLPIIEPGPNSEHLFTSSLPNAKQLIAPLEVQKNADWKKLLVQGVIDILKPYQITYSRLNKQLKALPASRKQSQKQELLVEFFELTEQFISKFIELLETEDGIQLVANGLSSQLLFEKLGTQFERLEKISPEAQKEQAKLNLFIFNQTRLNLQSATVLSEENYQIALEKLIRPQEASSPWTFLGGQSLVDEEKHLNLEKIITYLKQKRNDLGHLHPPQNRQHQHGVYFALLSLTIEYFEDFSPSFSRDEVYTQLIFNLNQDESFVYIHNAYQALARLLTTENQSTP